LKVRLKNIHIAISSLCAIAGVMIAGWQTFRSVDAPSAPRLPETTAALSTTSVNSAGKSSGPEASPPNVTEVTPTEPPGLAMASLDRARIAPATRPDTPARYRIADLFDGNPATYVRLSEGDTDIDFILEFPFSEAVTVSGIEIDTGDSTASAPGTLEVMILPDGSMAGGGREVTSLALSGDAGSQKFALPPEAGRAAWLRIAARPGQAQTIIGDIKLIAAAKP
jgi:hypothetical protein